ncbi:hypothetical protein CUMW_237720 [Citrus unshiu]|nr:hypothetical protein CUMW_237720 [Citrus unshiu]
MMLISWATRIAEPPKTGLEFWKTLFLVYLDLDFRALENGFGAALSFKYYQHCFSSKKESFGVNVPVELRAWRSTKGESLIPFADFLNHDGLSEAVVLHDEDKQLSEVIADRDYAPKEEVWITYGKFPNSTLLLDFGFSLPYNSYDEGAALSFKYYQHCFSSMKESILVALGSGDLHN